MWSKAKMEDFNTHSLAELHVIRCGYGNSLWATNPEQAIEIILQRLVFWISMTLNHLHCLQYTSLNQNISFKHKSSGTSRQIPSSHPKAWNMTAFAYSLNETKTSSRAVNTPLAISTTFFRDSGLMKFGWIPRGGVSAGREVLKDMASVSKITSSAFEMKSKVCASGNEKSSTLVHN